MKRKIVTGLGLILVAGLLSSTTFADTDTNGTWDDDGATQVTYTVPSTYTVVIPDSIALTVPDTAVGTANNVFIKTNSQIADTETITVSLAPQTFTATKTISSIPFTVSYAAQNGTTTSPTVEAAATLSTAVSILTQTGAQIAVVGEMTETTAGAPDLSATVQAKVTAAQIAEASTAGQHTGTIQFSVVKS
ncbi:hypothetical protein RyT2_01440 [Pseudolactococcus yaeyamensis]